MSERDTSEDRAALTTVAAGGRAGEKALEQLYRTHRPRLLAFLRARGLAMHEAEDAVQQVFVKVVQNAHSFRGESAVSSWLFQIARNEMVNLFRATKREVLIDEDGWDAIENDESRANPVCSAMADPKLALQKCFDQAYASFHKAHPEAGELIRQTLENEDWDGRDMALYLGRTYNAAREYFSQCKKKLAKYMEPCRHLLGEQA